jgi:hypothetical protein
MNELTCSYLPRADGASVADLERLFPPPSISAALLPLLEDSGIDGFQLGSIVVSRDDVPIFFMPLFETRFDLSTFVEGWLKKALKAAGRLLPPVFHPRVLCVGLADGEWSELGIDPHLPAATLEAAYRLAFGQLQAVATRHKSDVVALYNFNQFGRLPEGLLPSYHRVPFRPCARLSIDFDSVEQYLSRLSRGSRKHLRRKMRVAPQVRILHSREVAPYLERIYALYRDTVARSPMPLGSHNRLYFEEICQRVPGAEYVLYFVQEKLVAFNLLFLKWHEMVDKFFCMEYGPGSKFNLYALSWLENVRSCVEQGIPLYCAGQGTEETKAHLGTSFIPSYLLFKHRWRVFNRLLGWPHTLPGKFLARLGFWPRFLPVVAQLPVSGLPQQAAARPARPAQQPGRGATPPPSGAHHPKRTTAAAPIQANLEIHDRKI